MTARKGQASWIDNDTLLLNHVKNSNGMWSVQSNGTGAKHLRPAHYPD